MTSNDVPAPGAGSSGGRRRVLGRGPGAAPVAPSAEPEPARVEPEPVGPEPAPKPVVAAPPELEPRPLPEAVTPVAPAEPAQPAEPAEPVVLVEPPAEAPGQPDE